MRKCDDWVQERGTAGTRAQREERAYCISGWAVTVEEGGPKTWHCKDQTKGITIKRFFLRQEVARSDFCLLEIILWLLCRKPGQEIQLEDAPKDLNHQQRQPPLIDCILLPTLQGWAARWKQHRCGHCNCRARFLNLSHLKLVVQLMAVLDGAVHNTMLSSTPGLQAGFSHSTC